MIQNQVQIRVKEENWIQIKAMSKIKILVKVRSALDHLPVRLLACDAANKVNNNPGEGRVSRNN